MKCEKCGHDNTKIKLLKGELVELEKRVKDTELEFNQSLKFLKHIENIDTRSPENREIHFKMMKEGFSAEIEQFRAKIDMIRKISPESANNLEYELNFYEKNFRINLENLQKTSDPSYWLSANYNEVLEIFLRMFTTNSKIAIMLNLCKNCIRDTIKRLE